MAFFSLGLFNLRCNGTCGIWFVVSHKSLVRVKEITSITSQGSLFITVHHTFHKLMTLLV